MSTSFSPSQIQRLKHEAKMVARAKGIPHSEALDRVAVEYGYTNWSLLMKHRVLPEDVVELPAQGSATASGDGKLKRFESMVHDVLESCAADNGQQFNFADVEWVAVEAKALGLLATQADVGILVQVLVKNTTVSESVCREEIEPVLGYRLALDTHSSRALGRMVESQGLTAAARSIGISRQTLEKLITGGSRGPLFRHEPVSAVTIAKVRAYLTGPASLTTEPDREHQSSK